MRVFTLFNPAEITPEVLDQLKQLSPVGNLSPNPYINGRWLLVPGVSWPGALQVSARQADEDEATYIARIRADVQAHFDAGLPGGLVLTNEDFALLRQTPEWIAREAAEG